MPRPLILAVEDEEPILQLLRTGLPLLGFDVLAASSGAEAVELYRARRGDIAAVLLDVVLSDMTGLDVFAELRRVNPAVRACFVTGWGSSAPEDRLSKFKVVRKPFVLADLAGTLRELLA